MCFPESFLPPHGVYTFDNIMFVSVCDGQLLGVNRIQLRFQFVLIFTCFVSVSSACRFCPYCTARKGRYSLGLCLCTLELIPSEALLPQRASSPKLQKKEHILPLVLSNYADLAFPYPYNPVCGAHNVEKLLLKASSPTTLQNYCPC